jgi:hypothetical protein
VHATARSRAEADAAAIARATGFRVIRFVGRGRYDEIGVFETLDAARCEGRGGA